MNRDMVRRFCCCFTRRNQVSPPSLRRIPGIGDMDVRLQATLLPVLENREFQPMAASKTLLKTSPAPSESASCEPSASAASREQVPQARQHAEMDAIVAALDST